MNKLLLQAIRKYGKPSAGIPRTPLCSLSGKRGGNRLTTKRVRKMLEIKDLVKGLIQNHITKING